jgi:hypothetical protein
MTTAPLTKTHSTKLTQEETARAASGIKLLAASRGFTQYAALHAKLAASGYPASYATFGRLMNATRVAQRSEIELIARYFNIHPRDLTGEAVNPVKDPAPPRLIEYDVPAAAPAPEGPVRSALTPPMRRPSRLAPDPLPESGFRALADSVDALTAAIREQMEWQKTAAWPGAADQLRQAG